MRSIWAVLLGLVSLSSTNAQADNYNPGTGWSLQWSDEFNGKSLDGNVWGFDIGTGANGWGNFELESYTNSSSNVWVSNGQLTIQAVNSKGAYTSARVKTQGKKTFLYGKIVARIQAPVGKGIWPAFWMLGENQASVGWPKCGEIDIFEMVGGGCGYDDTTHFSLHWQNVNGAQGDYTQMKSLSNCLYLSKQFHYYELEWNYDQIIGRLDGNQMFVMNTGAIADVQAFQKPFYMIFNLAVGGNWPGSPDSSTQFPQQMHVDWVRHYTNKNGGGTPPPTPPPPPPTGTADAVSSSSPPSTVPTTGSFVVPVSYSAAATRTIVVDLLKTSDYSKYATGSTTVNKGVGTVNLNVPLGFKNVFPTAGTNYIINIWEVDPSIYQNGNNANAFSSATSSRSYPVTVINANTNAQQVPGYSVTPSADLLGGDINSNSLAVGDSIACGVACNQNSACIGFVTNAAGNACWLKRALGASSANSDRNAYKRQNLDDSIISITAPASVGSRGSLSVSVSYTAKAARVITVDLLRISDSSKYGTGSVTVPLWAGSIAVNVNLCFNNVCPTAGGGYEWSVWSVDPVTFDNGNNPNAWKSMVAQKVQTGVSVNAVKSLSKDVNVTSLHTQNEIIELSIAD